MLRWTLITCTLFLPGQLMALDFQEALKNLENHVQIQSLLKKSEAISKEAKIKASWGDPQFKIMAKNFPKDSLSQEESPMTGIEWGVSQKIPLTTKYNKIKKSFKALSKSYHYEAQRKKKELTKNLWEVLILQRKIDEELKILKENKSWVDKILKISKRLYANGKTSQQALLDIQIRRSEIENDIYNKKYQRSQIRDKTKYLTDAQSINNKTIPWELLKKKPGPLKDYRSLTFEERLKSKQFQLKASRLNYIPDFTLSLGLTKRSNAPDNLGDFASANLHFSLPLSGKKYFQQQRSLQEKYALIREFENYKRIKKRNLAILSKEIKAKNHEIETLNNKTIKFAKNLRSITSKSYALGNSSYLELLQSELKLQKILMHQTMLKAQRDQKKIALKYLRGDPLK